MACTPSVGVWFVGARGSVATTATVGLHALAAGLTAPTGCVSEHPDVDGRGLPGFDALVTGGHDISDTPLSERARKLAADGVLDGALVETLSAELAAADSRIRSAPATGPDQRATVAAIAQDIAAFGAGVERVVVVDVSSTQPPHDAGADGASWSALETAWAAGRAPLAPSSLYAAGALEAGAAYVAFTPSPGISVPALRERAVALGLPYAGADGKTGETLVKSVLAPMFASRALAVRSWTSINLLGGGDGATLADPDAARSKTETKGSGLEAMLGHPVDGPLRIEHVDDLGEWKTAWDHVRFDGFLGARMTLQFTWEGCDSALAAPLVLDLARLVARAHELGDSGPLAALGFFFKAPEGSPEHRLAEQFAALCAWSSASADRWTAAAARPAAR